MGMGRRMLEGVGVVGECCVGMSCLMMIELLGGLLLLLLAFRHVPCRPGNKLELGF